MQTLQKDLQCRKRLDKRWGLLKLEKIQNSFFTRTSKNIVDLKSSTCDTGLPVSAGRTACMAIRTDLARLMLLKSESKKEERITGRFRCK